MTDPTTTCATCGARLMPGAVFCQVCGKSVTGEQPSLEPTTLERLQSSLGDRYRVERELGRGGMATVFLAQDLRHDRPVAIKVLHPDLAATVGSERFDREIKVAAKLQHPHILTLYDSGSADGLLFYVMPFVQGESLRDRINRDRMLPVDEALGLTLEVADALGHAHALGIVHRDIKPENILLSNGHALVADFGIARAVSSAGDDQKLTQTGTAVGTPLYMSPEQAMGEEVGPSSDLYSLACMAYEMFTGQPPFTGANARAIMARHTMENVPSLRLVRDAVPEEVEEALLWALAKVPADRPQTAAQFAEAMGTPLGATSARRVASRPRVTAMRRSALIVVPSRRPWYVAAAVVFLAVAGAVGYGALRPSRPLAVDTASASRMAVMYFSSSTDSLGYLADGLTEGLIASLSRVPGIEVRSVSAVTPYRGASVANDSIARALNVGTVVRGSVEPDGDQVRVTVRMIGADGVPIGDPASFRHSAADPLALREALVQQVGTLIRTSLGAQIRIEEARAGTGNASAWVYLQRAERLEKQADSLSAATGDDSASARLADASDSLAAQAERADDHWADAPLARARIAYQRSRWAVIRREQSDRFAAGQWIEAGLGHVQRALALDSANTDALELIGNLRYWKWLLQLEQDPATAQRLLDSAQADLEKATRLNRNQAGAWATLSHLYNQLPSKGGVDISLAAQNALAADAFLSNASIIYWRLFTASYDLGDFVKARQTCTDAGRRFPSDPHFIECKLWMLTTRAEPLDVARAWALRDSLLAATPEGDRPYQSLSSLGQVAGVLARSPALADSARHVVGRALGNSEIDPTRDLANVAGFVYAQLGDTAASVRQLGLYLAVNGQRRQALASDPGWWYGPVADSPAYKRLVGPPPGR